MFPFNETEKLIKNNNETYFRFYFSNVGTLRRRTGLKMSQREMLTQMLAAARGQFKCSEDGQKRAIFERLIEAAARRATGSEQGSDEGYSRPLNEMCVGGITGTLHHCASFVFAALHIPPPLAS